MSLRDFLELASASGKLLTVERESDRQLMRFEERKRPDDPTYTCCQSLIGRSCSYVLYFRNKPGDQDHFI